MKARCPICKKEIEWKGNPYRPFCSERCKLVDLGHWATETYRVAADPEEEEETIDSPENEEQRSNGDSKGERGAAAH